MHVIATAGHVDHGKSTLVKALTGADPDRLEEEHRRGLSIELGYCWTSLPAVGDVAFVDVPGHERFISTMLSGIGPVPAVLFVVAADDPWMPQAAEHLAALDALGVSHGVLAVTRSDLADPGPALERAEAEFSRTTLREAPAVAVSGVTGSGLDELRARLVELVQSLPSPDPAADVRLWVDRCFHVRGAGTVVTGTLPAGEVRVGDRLLFSVRGSDKPGSQTVRVRGVHSMGRSVDAAQGVARVALNLTGPGVDALDRSSVLVTPGAWEFTDVVDVRISGRDPAPAPERPLLHVGATSVATHCRPLSDDLARLRFDRALPLRIGDHALLRDPGSRRVWGVTVLDPAPVPLRRRGASAERARRLAQLNGAPDLASEVMRRGLVRLSLLRRIGVDVRDADRVGLLAGDWLLSRDRAESLRGQMEQRVREHDQASALDPGIPLGALANQLQLPDPDLVTALVCPPMELAGGRVTSRRSVVLPVEVEEALEHLAKDFEEGRFAAPTADRLRELGLDSRPLAAAVKAGRLLRIADGVVLPPGADQLAAKLLADLPQPFTTSQARVRLASTRRVVLPLLQHLDRLGHTRRLTDDRRTVSGRSFEE